MDPIRDELLASLAGIASRPPAARLVSSVTGAAVEAAVLDAGHWWRNIRNPVRFTEAAAALIGEGYRIFVEIGPSAILHSYLSDGLRAADAEGRVVASLARNDGAGDPFPAIAARCYVAGYDLPAAANFDGPADPRCLPLYPWQRQRFWFDKTVEANDPESPPFDHPLLGFRQRGPMPHWLNHLDEQVLPWLADHAVEGMAVLPAAAILETALAAARWRWPEAAVLEAFDVEMRRPLPFDKGHMRELRTTIVADDGDWELASRPRLSSEPLTIHAVGRISMASDARPVLRWADSAPDGPRIEAESLYRLAQRAGLDYGSRFRTVDHVETVAADGAVVHLDPAPIGERLDQYLLHPALLDGALQGLIGLLAGHRRGIAGGRLSAVAVRPGPVAGAVWTHRPPGPAAPDPQRGADRCRPTSRSTMTPARLSPNSRIAGCAASSWAAGPPPTDACSASIWSRRRSAGSTRRVRWSKPAPLWRGLPPPANRTRRDPTRRCCSTP